MDLHTSVYPACAGIDLSRLQVSATTPSLPRMRGDRPKLSVSATTPIRFTPHARGSTIVDEWREVDENVYPACAGIDPTMPIANIATNCLPRMRGDRPFFVAIFHS